jgi:hypothetical protein
MKKLSTFILMTLSLVSLYQSAAGQTEKTYNKEQGAITEMAY